MPEQGSPDSDVALEALPEESKLGRAYPLALREQAYIQRLVSAVSLAQDRLQIALGLLQAQRPDMKGNYTLSPDCSMLLPKDIQDVKPEEPSGPPEV